MSTSLFLIENIDPIATKQAIATFCAMRPKRRIIELEENANKTMLSNDYEWLIIDCTDSVSQQQISDWVEVIELAQKTRSLTKYLFIADTDHLGYYACMPNMNMINLEVLKRWNTTIGLVLCGGESTRMKGRTKALLKYHNDLEQYKYIYNMLLPYCNNVFISIREEMSEQFDSDYNFLFDNLANIGPLSGMSAAYQQHAEQNLLVIGCDYPLLTEVEVLKLILEPNDGHLVTCYHNGYSLDPLLAFYSAEFAPHLFEAVKNKSYSIKKIILNLTHKIVYPENERHLTSIDDETSYENTLKLIK